jgi:hypothetical protein
VSKPVTSEAVTRIMRASRYVPVRPAGLCVLGAALVVALRFAPAEVDHAG